MMECFHKEEGRGSRAPVERVGGGRPRPSDATRSLASYRARHRVHTTTRSAPGTVLPQVLQPFPIMPHSSLPPLRKREGGGCLLQRKGP
ncbi:hypothetical protein SKAU_G00047030 [Synaphobranchus kaupii]|uniref:Uncharacterized protein n=1 Tax=Synaphobranchus kaupii TaxID=118154 RepID=A0A9Q1G282_SYNKA|nr:hypothetical protein SKAU_G00047030 [Synaphobranchus kaupii]